MSLYEPDSSMWHFGAPAPTALIPRGGICSERIFELRLESDFIDTDRLLRLRALLDAHPGDTPTRVVVHHPDAFDAVVALPDSLTVDCSEELISAVLDLFGDGVKIHCS